MRVVAAATATEIRTARRGALRVWILDPSSMPSSVFADLGDVARAEGEHEVSPLGDAPQHPGMASCWGM